MFQKAALTTANDLKGGEVNGSWTLSWGWARKSGSAGTARMDVMLCAEHSRLRDHLMDVLASRGGRRTWRRAPGAQRKAGRFRGERFFQHWEVARRGTRREGWRQRWDPSFTNRYRPV